MRGSSTKLKVHKHIDILEAIYKASPVHRIAILQNIASNVLILISELYKNLLKGQFPLGPSLIKQFKPFKHIIKSLSKKGIPISLRRQLIVQNSSLTQKVLSCFFKYLKEHSS